MTIYNFISWIINFVSGVYFTQYTPSCILLGFEIDDDKTCEDITIAYHLVFYATTVVVILIMMYRFIKNTAIFVKVIYLKIMMKYVCSQTGLNNSQICHLLINELNVVRDRHYHIWNKQTKAEVFNCFKKHKAKCKKCRDRFCIRNSSLNFTPQGRLNYLKQANRNELKLVFFNDNFNKKNFDSCTRYCKQERRIMKVNEWFSKQLNDYRELESERYTRKKMKWNVKNDNVPINFKINHEFDNRNELFFPQSKKVTNKNVNKSFHIYETNINEKFSTQSTTDKDCSDPKKLKHTALENLPFGVNLQKNLASSINKNQLNLNNINCNNNKKYKTDNEMPKYIDNIQFRWSKNYQNQKKCKNHILLRKLLYLSPAKKYPEWLLQNKKIFFKTNFENVNDKKGIEIVSKKKPIIVLNNYFNTSSELSKTHKTGIQVEDQKRMMKNINTKTLFTDKVEKNHSYKSNKSIRSFNGAEPNYFFYKDRIKNQVRNVKKAIEIELQKKIANGEDTDKNNKSKTKLETVIGGSKQIIQSPKNLRTSAMKYENINSFSEFNGKFIVKNKINKTKEFNVNSVSEENRCFANHILRRCKPLKPQCDSLNKKKLFSEKRPKLRPSERFQTPFSVILNKSRIKSGRVFKVDAGRRKSNSFKDEIIREIVNIPKHTRMNLQFKYKQIKNNSCRSKNKLHYTTGHLGVIFEHSPWAE